MGKRSLYAALVNRFSHLAANAAEDDEEEKKHREEEAAARRAREEGPEEEDEEEAGISEDERSARRGRNEKRRAKADKKDGDGDDEDDEDDDSPEAKAVARGRKAERARWGAVLASAEAKGRVPLACSLLADTGMSAEKIRAALLASPTEARQGLAARMAQVSRVDIGSGPAATVPDPRTPQGRVAAMQAAYDKALGRASDAR